MQKLKADGKPQKSFLRLLLKNIPLLFKASPFFFVLWMLSALLCSSMIVMRTLTLQGFFDGVTTLAAGGTTIAAVLFLLSLVMLSDLLRHIGNWAVNFLPEVVMIDANKALSLRMFKKLAKLKPIEFEDTDKLDDLNKANEGRSVSMWFAGTLLMITFFYIPYFIFMGWYLFQIKPILLLAIVAAFIPAVLSQFVNVVVFSKAEDESAPVRRESEHFAACISEREYFKETRLLGGYSFFINLYRDSVKRLNRITFKATVKTNLIILCLNLVTCAGIIGVLFLLVSSLLNGEISVGAFAAVFESIFMIFNIMHEIINMHLKNLMRSSGKMKNFLNLMEYEERAGDKSAPKGQFDIELKNVSFSYPKSENLALKAIDLTIRSGETVAIVGENGSGKSTIIRLITGLYTPTEGEVLHDGINTEEIKPDELFLNTSAVFQKFSRYQMLLNENISISDIGSLPEEKRLDTAMLQAGVSKDDKEFTDGYETMLSREFDGIDISGGVWQRVAIARAFYKKHGFVVLDEPTAAIDPIEETKIYNRFAELSRGKTAIIVTHRLGSVKLADRIFVMKQGELIESGTHDELTSLGREYNRMFLSQQKFYQ